MCKAAAQTAGNLFAAIRPTIVSLLMITKLTGTPEATELLGAYDAVTAALQNWKQGTPAQEVLQLIGDLQTLLSDLPIPVEYTVLLNIILAGVETVIGIITANSPAPVAPAGLVAHAELQAFHQASVAANTATKVQVLVPGFKRSIFHSPESQYNTAWNKAIDSGGFDSTSKTA